MTGKRPQLTVVLTSRENFVWHSMQEIIPALEQAWLRSAAPESHEVRLFNIDQSHFSEMVPLLMQADTIVHTCFTFKMCRLASLLRKELAIRARWIIHLHSQATIGCWPFHIWGMGEHLRSDDCFVSSCTRDAETLRLCFEEPRGAVIPFPNPEQESWNDNGTAAPATRETPFVFAGRISEQKNLHGLLYAFRLFLKSSPNRPVHLHFFGKTDDLGSPNMGLKSAGYQRTLNSLVASLGLEAHVTFHGHLERAALYERLFKEKHILVSASLHSDENFGMAAFRSLCAGNGAVLSDWGGHTDFAKDFANRIQFVPVHRSAAGPLIRPDELASALAAAFENYDRVTPALYPDDYREATIAAQLRHLVLSKREGSSERQLVPSPLAKRLVENRRRYAAEDSRSTRIFDSYADPDCEPFLRSYGMGNPRVISITSSETRTPGKSLCAVPWASVLPDSSITGNDPHRGELRVPLALTAEPGIAVVDLAGKAHQVPEETARQALALGLLHA